jgi:hypothetical protein
LQMLFCAFLLALWCKALIFSTKHRFLEKNIVSALFTINPKVSFKSKNVKLFKEIDKKFYLKLIKLFSYRRYAANPSSCFYGRWLSPSVKELSPQSGLLSKALRSSDKLSLQAAQAATALFRGAPAPRTYTTHERMQSTNACKARTHAKHERMQSTNACKARTYAKHERMQSTNACKARTHAKHARIQSTHAYKARTYAKHARMQSTHVCKARTHAKHARIQSTHAYKARTHTKHARIQSTNACKARTHTKHARMQSTNACKARTNAKHARTQSTHERKARTNAKHARTQSTHERKARTHTHSIQNPIKQIRLFILHIIGL